MAASSSASEASSFRGSNCTTTPFSLPIKESTSKREPFRTKAGTVLVRDMPSDTPPTACT